MTKKKSTKRAFISSLLILAMCFTMLAGTTFAWFTDSVTSSGNRIISGKLSIDLLIKADGDTDYVSVKANPAKAVFDYDKWEPGYTAWANAKVVTDGNLALKYTMKIAANGTVSALADVIDVYYAASEIAKPATRPADLTALGLTNIGTLRDALNGTVVINDTLIPGQNAEDAATIVLHMQESAGNEYQEMSIGSNFAFQILATQYTYESDSFDETYDENAQYPTAIINGNAITRPLTAADFTANSTIELVEPFNGTVELPDGITVIGNGNALNATVTGNKTITLKNINTENITVTDFSGELTLEDGLLQSDNPNGTGDEDAAFFYDQNTGDGGVFKFINMNINPAQTKGIKIAKAKEVYIEGCTFDATGVQGAPTDPTVFNPFARSVSLIDIQEQNTSEQMKITIKNCTFKGSPNGSVMNGKVGTDTAGAIKIKSEKRGFESVTITGNTFTDCYRDIVAGVNLNRSGSGFLTGKTPELLTAAANDVDTWTIEGNSTNSAADKLLLIAANQGRTQGYAEAVGRIINGAAVYNTADTTIALTADAVDAAITAFNA